MNYSGKFDATISDALGKHPSGHLFSETVHAAHAPSDAIVVPDAQLLFGGEFKRTGVDLVLSGDGRELVLHDYFKGEKHAPLASPDGAHLTGDLVDALAGQVQYAQAGGNAAAGQVIGHVTKLAGTATAIRNGVSIILNNGDNVEKGDVVASGSDSTVGITFIDGTVFGLSSNARMVLNEMVYDPNGSNNSSLLSLVAGTITFVAGETAKHGDMKVDTPVATMGIRGTAVLVEIDFSVPGTTPDAKFQVLVEPDGTTGSYILFDKTTLTPLAVVDKAGMQINVSNGVMSQTLAPLSPEIQKLITDVFSLKFSDSTNTKSIEHFTDSIVPNAFGQVNFALVNGNLSTFAAPPPPPAGTGGSAPSAPTTGHQPIAPQINSADPGTITELPHLTNNTAVDKVTGQIQYYDVNVTDHDTVSVKFSSFTYQDAKGHDVTGSLTSLQLADIAKVEAAVTVSGNTGPNVGGFGSATWNYSVTDKAFDFLAAGETLTLTYTATVDNNYQPLDQTGSQTITITITGTNDVPVITSPQQNVSFAASGTDTKGGDLIPNTVTHGTLAFTDPDLTDTHTVAVQMTSALLDGQPLSATAGQTVINELAAAVTASIAKGDDSTGTGAGTIDWTLANLQVYLADLVPAGESLVLTYAVTVTDSQGATSVQDIVVTIGGNNEAAVVWTNTNPIPPGGVAQWSDAANWEGDRAPSTQGTDDVFIGTDQLQPGTPVFPATVTDAEAAKSLTMDYFTDFGASIPELDILSTGTLTIAGALKMDTSTDSGSPLTAESIIKNFGTLSVGGIATLLKHSVLDNYGTLTLAQGGVFGDQSSITNSGTIEIVSDTLDVQVGIADAGGLLQVDGGATLKLSDGATITKGEVTLGSLSVLDVEMGAVSLPAGTADATLDGVTVIGTSGLAPSAIQIGASGAATLLLDDGTSIKNGDLTISGGSALDVTTSGATLDGVTVTGTNATLSVAASTIEVGTTTTTGTVLTLDDGTTITNGNLIIDAGNTLDIESAGGATLDGVDVMNSGTIDIGPSATLTLEDGTTITGGTVTVESGGSLHVDASGATLDDLTLSGSVTNSGTLTIDDTVTLNGATLNGGTIDDAGTLSVGASSEIENATVNGGGDLTVTGGTLTLSEVTLDDVTLSGSFTNSDKLTVKDTVTLNGATLNGGTIDDTGTLSVSASSEIENATVNGGGDLTVTGGTLTFSEVTLDGVTLAGSFTNSDTLTVKDTVTLNGATLNGGTIDDIGTLSVSASSEIENATVNGGGDLTVASGKTLTLSEVTLDNVTLAGSFTNSDTLTVKDTVTLNGATLNGGTIDDIGTLSVSASSEIENATVNGGGDLTVTGGTLTLSEVTLDDVTLAGSFTNSDTLTIKDTVTLNGATINGGTIDDTGTLSVSASSEIENATVNGGGDLTVTGGTLTFSEVTLDGVTLAGSFTNSDTLTVKDTVTLNGATLNGGTIDDIGTLSVSASSEIENATVNGGGDLTVASGKTLTLSEVTLDNVTLAGSFTNADTLTVKDTVTLNGATLNGGTIDDIGTLSVSASSEIENATVNGGGDLTVASGKTLTLSEVTLDNVTLAGSFTNADTLTVKDTVTLNGATLNGGTIDDIGTLSVSASSEIENATVNGGGDLTVTSGTLTFSEVTLDDVTLAGSFTNSDTLTIKDTVTLNGATLNGGTIDDTGAITGYGAISSVIAGLGVLTASGGTLTLSGLNTYSGVTTIDSGAVLAAGVADAFSASSAVTDNGELDLGTTDQTIAALNGTNSAALVGSFSGTGTSPAVLTINNGGSFAGVVEDGSAGAATALTLAGGTLTLTGDNLYTGVTTISGTLVLSGSGSIAGSSDVVDDGTFDISATTSGASIVTLSGDGTVALGTKTLTLSNASTTFSGAIDGSGGLTLTAGTETLTGDNLYTGATTIDGGTLVLSGSGSIAGSSDVVDDGTLDISATTSGASVVTLSGNGTVALGSKKLTLTNASTTFSGTIGGTGGLALLAGMLTLTGDSSYSGTTTISGTLALSGSGSIADSSDVIDNGTFDIMATTSGASIVTLSGDGAVKLGSQTLTLTKANNIFSGVISGSGGLTVDGTGTETLSGINTFGGATTIGSGETLALSGTGSIAGSSDVIDNGTFDISGTTSGASIVTLSGNGTIKLGAETLTLSDASTTFSGTIGGTGGLTLTAGTETLTGNNTYSGVTTINGGTLALSGSGSIAGSSDVVDDGTFDISATTSGASIVTLSGDGTVTLGSKTLTLSDASTTFSGAIDGSGGLTLTAGTETLSGDNLYTGATTINGGTLKLSGLGSIAGSSDVVDDGTFDISATTSGASIVTLSGDGTVKLGSKTLTLSDASTTFSGTIGVAGDTGGLTLTAGTETLTGNNTYSGVTTINGGTLALSGSGSIAHSSDVIDGGTFDISATTSGASIVTLSGDGAVALGGKTLTLSDASTTFSGTISSTGGGITVASGTLTLGTMTLDDLTLAGSFSNSGTLTIDDTVTLNGATISGGTLDISGILDSTGTTTISGATIVNSDHIDVVSGTLTIDPTPVTNTGTIEVHANAALVLSGEVVTNSHGVTSVIQEVVTNTNGVIQIDPHATLTLFDTTINGGTIDDNGTLLLTGTTSKLENVTFSGTASIDISSHATLEIGGSVSSGVTVKFDVSNGHSELILDNPSDFHGVVEGLVEASSEADENYIDLEGFADTTQTKVTSAVFNSATDVTAVTITNGTKNLTIDLHGDYSKGDIEFATDHNGGTLFSDPAANSGAVTVDSGTTLDIGAASTATITFANSTGTTGELVLADSKDFSGAIVGFTGDGTTANSDLIDATDVNIADVALNKTTYTDHGNGTGTLTLYNASGQALDSTNFDGNYQLANFTIENDGNGGTLIVDPPVTTNAQAPVQTVAASGPNQVLSGSAPSDNFVFSFNGVGQSAVANFHPATDTLQFSSSVFANAQAALNAAHDDGHGNSVIVIDSHDSITLNGVLKAQLHASDFHFV